MVFVYARFMIQDNLYIYNPLYIYINIAHYICIINDKNNNNNNGFIKIDAAKPGENENKI